MISGPKEQARKMLLLFLAIVFVLVVVPSCGGGGGGGGGGTVVTPDPEPEPEPEPGDPPVQSSWSPAKSSSIATKSPTVTFSTDVTSTCKWSLLDRGYDDMSYTCSGGGTTSHSCSISGMTEGSDTIYVSCKASASSGGTDTSSTNEHIPYIVDTTGPTVSFTAPNDGAQFLNYTRPSSVAVSYSDSGVGVSLSTLGVSFTLQGREVDISGLFPRDASANAAQSATAASNTDPMYRTTLTQFGSSALSAAEKSWVLDRSGSVTMRVIAVDSERLFVWDSSGTSAWLLDSAAPSLTRFTPFSSSPLSVAVSAASGKFYAVFSGDANLYEYNLSDGSALSTQPLPGSPAAVSHNKTLNRVYVSYQSRQEISVWKCSTGTFGIAITLDHVPDLMAAWNGSPDQVITLEWSGSAHMYRINSSGTKLLDVVVDDQIPEDLLVDSASGYIFAALYESPGRVAAVNSSTGAKSYITVGDLPFRLASGETGRVLSISDDDGSVTFINTGTLSAASTVSPATPVSDVAFLSGPGGYFIAEDVWKLPGLVSCTISAEIEDTLGNSGTARISVDVAPGVAARRLARVH